MALTDKIVGGLMLVTAVVVFTYYTIWTLLTPFLPPSSPLHQIFPAREWAIRIPAILMLAGLTAIGSFVGLVMIKSSRKRKRSFSANETSSSNPDRKTNTSGMKAKAS